MQCDRRPVQPEVGHQLVNCDRDIIGQPLLLQIIMIRREALEKTGEKTLINFDEDVKR